MLALIALGLIGWGLFGVFGWYGIAAVGGMFLLVIAAQD